MFCPAFDLSSLARAIGVEFNVVPADITFGAVTPSGVHPSCTYVEFTVCGVQHLADVHVRPTGELDWAY